MFSAAAVVFSAVHYSRSSRSQRLQHQERMQSSPVDQPLISSRAVTDHWSGYPDLVFNQQNMVLCCANNWRQTKIWGKQDKTCWATSSILQMFSWWCFFYSTQNSIQFCAKCAFAIKPLVEPWPSSCLFAPIPGAGAIHIKVAPTPGQLPLLGGSKISPAPPPLDPRYLHLYHPDLGPNSPIRLLNSWILHTASILAHMAK